MRAKLLGAVSAAALLGSVTIANAQGPMQLTDTQLDTVTAGNFAGISINLTDAILTSVFIELQSSPVLATALVQAGIVPNGPNPSLTLSAGAQAP